MKHRTASWLILLWAVAWFGLIVPIHNRGQIRLDEADVGGCCHKSCASETDPSDQAPVSPEDPVGHCAVCFLVAHLDVPAATGLTLFPCAMVEVSACTVERRPASIPDRSVDSDRGPPILV